jgi:hypothetical protein
LLLEEQIKYWEGKCMQELICGCVLCSTCFHPVLPTYTKKIMNINLDIINDVTHMYVFF